MVTLDLVKRGDRVGETSLAACSFHCPKFSYQRELKQIHGSLLAEHFDSLPLERI